MEQQPGDITRNIQETPDSHLRSGTIWKEEEPAGTPPAQPVESTPAVQAFTADEAPLPPGWHRHADGSVHCHSHLEDGSLPAGHEHPHTHTHTQTRAVINRLSRAIGHLESVRSMVENGRDCTEILVQLAAVRSALSSTAKVILKDHLEHCIIEGGVDAEAQLQALNDAIDKFM